jgi:hypothetical protein
MSGSEERGVQCSGGAVVVQWWCSGGAAGDKRETQTDTTAEGGAYQGHSRKRRWRETREL